MEASDHIRAAAPKTKPPSLPALGDYANLRRGGASAAQAGAFLRLDPRATRNMEKAFRGQVARGAGEAQPRFARHDKHVAAIMSQGGFPAPPKARPRRRRGFRPCARVCGTSRSSSPPATSSAAAS